METASDRAPAVDATLSGATDERISASAAARRFGVNRHTLVLALRAGRVRGTITSNGRGPGGVECRFHPRELEEDLARLPICKAEGCNKRALGPSGGCESHGHTLAGGRAAGVLRPDIGPKISAAKRGVPRPDAAERLRSSWAEPEGSPFTRGWARWRGGRVAQRWIGRWEGRVHGRAGGRQRGWNETHLSAARELRRRDPSIGRARLARVLQVTEEQAKLILKELAKG